MQTEVLPTRIAKVGTRVSFSRWSFAPMPSMVRLSKRYILLPRRRYGLVAIIKAGNLIGVAIAPIDGEIISQRISVGVQFEEGVRG